MESEEPPPSPLTFEGKTDEKGAPMVEGGKEEGGKGGPLVEGSKAVPEKNSEKESPKGAKSSGKKAPAPVIPKQRGGPDISTGKNETSTSDKEKEAKNTEEGSKVDENLKEVSEALWYLMFLTKRCIYLKINSNIYPSKRIIGSTNAFETSISFKRNKGTRADLFDNSRMS